MISPVDGRVLQIRKDFRNYLGEEVGAIDIEVNEISSFPQKDFNKKEQLGNIIESGIVDTQGQILPLIEKFEIIQKYKADTIIINGLEEIVANGRNYYFLQKKNQIIAQGLKTLNELLQPKRLIIALYRDFRRVEGIEEIVGHHNNLEIVFLKNKYPQHRIPILVRSILKQDYPINEIIEKHLKVSILDLETIYELGRLFNGYMPYREKLITVVKGDLTNTHVVGASIGTPIGHILNQLHVDLNSVSKVVVNGTISGTSLPSLDYPLTKEIGIIFVQNKGNEVEFCEEVCIKCGLCVEVCPMNLMPLFLSGYSQSNQFDFLTKFNIGSCIECGCCAYVCPVNIPLVQWIKYGKAHLQAQKSIA